jgi:hypothetical protein
MTVVTKENGRKLRQGASGTHKDAEAGIENKEI